MNLPNLRQGNRRRTRPRPSRQGGIQPALLDQSPEIRLEARIPAPQSSQSRCAVDAVRARSAGRSAIVWVNPTSPAVASGRVTPGLRSEAPGEVGELGEHQRSIIHGAFEKD
jgi:hypothetical protein